MYVNVKLLNKTIMMDYSDCLNISHLKAKIAKVTKTSTKYKTRIILNGVEQKDSVNLLTLGLNNVNFIFYIITKELKNNKPKNDLDKYTFLYRGIKVDEIEV